ncbi:MAG: hypothetical protein BA869_00630 [Desulfuromonadales bacterium C00003107]|nr:MAG: hypothetical protein BA869_00630 [Desulfuromonadales bacterium C00003107]
MITAAVCPQCKGTGKSNLDLCSVCGGKGTVSKRTKVVLKIKKGVESGYEIRIPKAGRAPESQIGGEPGDLHVILNVLPHPVFERRGADLYMKAPISFAQAALGGEIMVKTIDSKQVKVKIPAETQTDARLRLRGLGMPMRGDKGRGDLYVAVVVETPRKLTVQQKELLRQALVGA